MEIQVLFSQWLGQLANYLHLSYGFGAGMVSAVNPCGFAMLPVYLTLYLGADDTEFNSQSILLRILKAIWVTAIVTSGFALLFLIAGSIILMGGHAIMAFIPWLAVIVGVVLVLAGLWFLMGNHFSLGFLLNWAGKIGDPRKMGVGSFFLFGLAFGVTSMSCTLPIFLAVVGSAFAQGDFVAGLGQFFAFVLGMSSVLLTLTLAIAFVKQGAVVGTMRKMLPFVHKISAIFLIIAGGYIIYYWLSSGLF